MQISIMIPTIESACFELNESNAPKDKFVDFFHSRFQRPSFFWSTTPRKLEKVVSPLLSLKLTGAVNDFWTSANC